MKKYSEYLAEQYEPMTAEELKSLKEFGNSTEKDLLKEIMYLRSVLAECYMWMGRKVHSGSITKKYQWAMKECYRIRQEDKE